MARFLFLIFSFAILLRAADKPADPVISEKNYRVFRGDGSAASFSDLVAAAHQVNVIFLGETHDDRVAHYLELEVLKSMAAPDTVLSLEMFERDTQSILNEYLAGSITEKYLISDGRAWNNYKTDYKPLIEFAKDRKLRVLAANAPARFINRVTRLGPDSLSALDEEARRNLPPLPYEKASPQYAEKFHHLMDEMGKDTGDSGKKESKPKAGKKPPEPPPATHMESKWALDSQSLWDATMAYSIAATLEQNPAAHIVQVNGLFHSEQRLGIPDHLQHYWPGATMLVVTMEPDKSFPAWSPDRIKNAGDFVIITDPSLPRGSSDSTPADKKGRKSKQKS